MGMTLARLLILSGIGFALVGVTVFVGAPAGLALVVAGVYLAACGVFAVDVGDA